MKRRTFCSTVLGGGLALGAAALVPSSLLGAGAARAAESANPAETSDETGRAGPDLVAVQGADAVAALDAGLAAMGGMGRFVQKGKTVLIKPNMGWAVTPEGGANTNPLLVKRLAEHCFTAGAGKVTLFDNPCDHWTSAYADSGIASLAKAAGVVVAPPNSEGYYQNIALPGATVLKQASVHELYLEADVVINVPVLKHHGGAGLSCAMKNLMGVVWDRRFYHRNGLDRCIADFCLAAKRPALNVVDAGRVMLNGGPRGQSNSQFRKLDLVILGADIVAVDVASALAFGTKPGDFAYIGLGAAAGVGRDSLDGLDVRRLRI